MSTTIAVLLIAPRTILSRHQGPATPISAPTSPHSLTLITLHFNYILVLHPSWECWECFGYLLLCVRATLLFVKNWVLLFVKVPIALRKGRGTEDSGTEAARERQRAVEEAWYFRHARPLATGMPTSINPT